MPIHSRHCLHVAAVLAILSAIMARPLNIDRDVVKAHAIAHGLPSAAECFDISLNTVKAWSARGKWFANAGKAIIPQPLPTTMKPVQPKRHVSGSEAMLSAMGEMNSRTRFALAKAADKGARHLARQKPVEIIAKHEALGSIARTADRVYGWSATEVEKYGRELTPEQLDLVLNDALARLPELEAKIVEMKSVEQRAT
jgi:hypothetical protein